MDTKNCYVKVIIMLVIVGSVTNSSGDNIARRIRDRYDFAAEKCVDSHGNDKAAYECSGLLIRGVRQDVKLKYPWSLKDLNKKKNAFSVAYLRKDQLFSKIPRGYDSGFIIYPHLETPIEKTSYKVYCAFPMDANADRRKGHGCGYNYADKSKKGVHCRKQNIKSLNSWKSQYKKIMNSRAHSFTVRQCAFDMTIKSAVEDFALSIEANKYLQRKLTKYAYRNNELRMRAWNERKPNEIPMETFFYIIDSTDGKRHSEKYQDQYYSRVGGTVPIVGIQLPSANKNFEVTLYARTPQRTE